MHTRRSAVAVILAIASLLLVTMLTTGGATLSSAPSETSGEAAGKGGADEAAEQAEQAQERLDAWKEAKAAGNLKVTTTAAAAPTTGWAGETVMSATADDWEPAIAADPNSAYVYLLTTRYTGPTACGNKCPLPYMMLRVSSDGGVTWGPDRYLCTCSGVSGQFDPEIEVAPNTGAVYAAFMNGYNINFSKSTDHGATWSTPVPVYGKVSWTDKPILAVSDNGQDVYIAFNGPTGGDPYVAQSHNGGATWTQTKTVDSTRYYYAFDGDVLPNGTVVFSESSLDYANANSLRGQNFIHVLRSTNTGTSWTMSQVDTVEIGPDCTAAGCSSDYYPGHTAISADASGALVLLYDGATVSKGNETVYARRSTDGGVTWSARVALSTAGEMADFPAVESRGSGDVRAWYMQTNGGNFDAWNVWYRSSTNGGSSWSSPVLISDSLGGAPYKTASGFGEPYGDYGEAAITNGGKFIGIWGEGPNYTGPGGVWVNRQT
jgi:hypothetical protein